MSVFEYQTPLWRALYNQKCSGIGIYESDALLTRFLCTVTPKISDRILDLSDQGLRPDCMPIVRQLLRHFRGTIDTLSLDMNPLCDEGVLELLSCKDELASLKTLRLSSVGLSPLGFQELFLGLADRPDCTLETIDLSSVSSATKRNRPGDIGARALGVFLSRSQTIRSIDLTSTQLRDTVGVCLLRSVRGPSPLVDLVLRNTGIVDGAIIAMFKPVTPRFPFLRTLDLSSNNGDLTEHCCQMLAHGIHISKHLKTLSLNGNHTMGPKIGLVFEALHCKSAALAAEAESLSSRQKSRNDWKFHWLEGVHEGVANYVRTGKIILERHEYDAPDGEGAGADAGADAGAGEHADVEGTHTEEDIGSAAGPSTGTARASKDASGAEDAAGGDGVRDSDGDGDGEFRPSEDTCSLESLDLSGVPVCADALRTLARSFRVNETVTTLSMSGCGIDLAKPEYQEPFAEFCRTALASRTLMALGLGKNMLRLQGAAQIAANLCHACVLETLNLSYAKLDDGALVLLAKALPSCAALRSLSLRGNNGDEECFRAFYLALQQYPRLTALDLGLNRLSFAFAERLEVLVRGNADSLVQAGTGDLDGRLAAELSRQEALHAVQAEIAATHGLLAQKGAELRAIAEDVTRDHAAWSAKVAGLAAELDGLRAEMLQAEGALAAVNADAAQLRAKSDSAVAVVDLKRRRVREKINAHETRQDDVIEQMERAAREFAEGSLNPLQAEVETLRKGYDFKVKDLKLALGALLGTECLLLQDKRVTAGGGPGAPAGSSAGASVRAVRTAGAAGAAGTGTRQGSTPRAERASVRGSSQGSARRPARKPSAPRK